MGKIPNYIMFNNLTPDLQTQKYEIDTKYQITDEDENYYYLKQNKIDKQQKDINYIVGEIIRPRT